MFRSHESAELFEAPADYDRMLQRGLSLSGEDKHFYIRGRLRHLSLEMKGQDVARILDFGCGVGDTTSALAELFPEAEVTGVDSAGDAIQFAVSRFAGKPIRFFSLDEFVPDASFDLCYMNGVLHHVPHGDRASLLRTIRRSLTPRGRFALFENNPWNPGTRLVMRRIPFDRDAEMISGPSAVRLLEDNGFKVERGPAYLFVFPRFLAWLRRLEPGVANLPLGGQYFVLARRAS